MRIVSNAGKGQLGQCGLADRDQSRPGRPRDNVRIRRCRRVATRYEKKAANFAGFVYLAAFVTAED